MRSVVPLRVLTVSALLLASSPSLAAQQPHTAAGSRMDGRLWVEGYVTRLRLQRDEHAGMEGLGARLLLPVSRQLAVGAFVSRAPAPVRDRETLHLGAQADVFPLARPLGRLDPVLSLGLGTMIHEETVWDRPLKTPDGLRPLYTVGIGAPSGASLLRLEERRDRGVTIAPGAGLRLRIAPGLALRGDVRHLIVLGRNRGEHLEVTGGVSLMR